MRRSYINWNDAADCLPEKSDREYLVADVYEKETRILICKFYRKGDIVNLRYRKECAPEPKSAEDKLIRAIFGEMIMPFEVEEDGFYEKVPTHSDEDTEVAERLDKVGDGGLDYGVHVYWAELPCAPNGAMHPYDVEDEGARRAAEYREDRDQEFRDSIDAFCNGENEYMKAYRAIHKDPENAFKGREIGHGIILDGKDESYKTAAVVSALVLTAGKQIKDEIPEEDQKKAWEDREVGEAVYTKISEIIKQIWENAETGFEFPHRIFRRTYWLTCRYFMYDKNLNNDDLCFDYAFRLLRKHDIFDRWVEMQQSILPENVLYGVLARSVVSAGFRGNRAVHLVEIGAPEIIMANEFRMVTEAMLVMFSTIVEPITEEKAVELFGDVNGFFCGKYDFGSQYGFTTDGEWCEYNPIRSSGSCAEDENGNPVLPDYGTDENGDSVRFDTYHYVWEEGDNAFFERGEGEEQEDGSYTWEKGKAYKITSYRTLARA